MAVKTKDIATFLLGAAAGAAALKYASMTDEEKEKMINSIKEKAGDFKSQAEDSVDKAKEYFNDLKSKSSDFLKDNWSDAEKYLQELFKGKTKGEEVVDDVADEVKQAVRDVDSAVEEASDDWDNTLEGEDGKVIPV